MPYAPGIINPAVKLKCLAADPNLWYDEVLKEIEENMAAPLPADDCAPEPGAVYSKPTISI